jgi:hypothetical protein
MVHKNIRRVPDGIDRDNVEFAERRKTNSKYCVSIDEKIAAVFNIKFSAFAAEIETITPRCTVERARAIWAMRSHFIREIVRDNDVNTEDYVLLDIDDVDFEDDEIAPIAPAPRKVAGTRRAVLYRKSRRLISKEIANITKALADLQIHLVEKPL